MNPPTFQDQLDADCDNATALAAYLAKHNPPPKRAAKPRPNRIRYPVKRVAPKKQTCITCYAVLPIDEFNLDRSCKTGHKSRCKPCQREVTRAYYHSSEVRRQRQIAASKEWQENNYEKYRAYLAKYEKSHPKRDKNPARRKAKTGSIKPLR